MEEEPIEQKILFYYDNDIEYNFTEVFTCISNLICSACNQKKFLKEVMEINLKLYTTCNHNKLTKFKKGTIFINNVEFEIMDFDLYYYFFVNNKRYHRIGICKVNKDAFYLIKELENEYLNKKRLLYQLDNDPSYLIDTPHDIENL